MLVDALEMLGAGGACIPLQPVFEPSVYSEAQFPANISLGRQQPDVSNWISNIHMVT